MNTEEYRNCSYRLRRPSWHVWAMAWTLVTIVLGSYLIFSFIPVDTINRPTLSTIIANFLSVHVTGFATILIVLRLRVPPGERLVEACLDKGVSSTIVLYAVKKTMVLVPMVIVLNIGILEFMKKMNWATSEDPVINWFLEASPFIITLLAVGAIVIAPVAEEFMFRLVLFNTLQQFFGRTFANISTSLVFAVSHLKPEQILPLFILATVLQRSFNQSNNIVLPIAIHSVFNGFMVILVLVERYFLISIGA